MISYTGMFVFEESYTSPPTLFYETNHSRLEVSNYELWLVWGRPMQVTRTLHHSARCMFLFSRMLVQFDTEALVCQMWKLSRQAKSCAS